MSKLDALINEHFAGLVVRKDLVKAVKGNAIVPSYVLEYLLGQYCATNDEDSIQSGIETVKEILRKHYVHRNEAGLIRSTIKEKGRHKVIDKISVDLNEKTDSYEASFANLGIKKVLVDSGTVKAHPKLLVSGVWCIADVEYAFSEEANSSPWILSTLKPIQLSRFDFESYLAARGKFDVDQWIDLLIQSIGFDPELLGRRSKLIQLVRLIPFCERNYNLIELGPKGTGKSHIYSEFSPHGILISGGEVTVPKLFVTNTASNNSGKIGLVGYWDVVAFDEFAGKKKKANKALVDIMKNYMANKSFSRGVETIGAEASMVFVGNTKHTVPHMLRHSDLFDELPEQYHDSAFLDRIHFYIPGWEVDIIRGEMFSTGYGFVVDYLAEILRSLRNHDLSDRYKKFFTLSSDISTRDRDGIHKTFSGLMKILYPEGDATELQVKEILELAIEGRKRVKDQLMRIDSTFTQVDFGYTSNGGEGFNVTTLEEVEYPNYYYQVVGDGDETEERGAIVSATPSSGLVANPVETPSPETRQVEKLPEGHYSYQENQKGVCFDTLFGPYLKGARTITIQDPYIRLFHQARNLMELLETIAKINEDGDQVSVDLLTVEDEFNSEQQIDFFQSIQASAASIGINFTWEFSKDEGLHARHILTDEWRILLDRGLDIFQRYEMNNAFSFANKLQQYRGCKAFDVTYLKS